MRGIAQALIAHSTGKLPDQATITLTRDYYSPTRRDAAAQRYLAAKQQQRTVQRARTHTLAYLLLGSAVCIGTGFALAPTPTGFALCMLGTAAMLLALIPSRP